MSVTAAAEAAGVSRETWHRMERGEASVTMGAWLNAFAAVGLELVARDPHVQPDDALPASVPVRVWPQLSRLAWQLAPSTELTAREAFALYERNWRHVHLDALDDAERDFIRRLQDAFGGGVALV